MKFLVISLCIMMSIALSPETANFLQGYAFGVGMGDEVPEIMDCILDVILINPEFTIIKNGFKKKDSLSIFNGIVDIFYAFDKFAQECGNTSIGLIHIQKKIKEIIKTPHLIQFVIDNINEQTERIQQITDELNESYQENDTYKMGHLIGEYVKVAFGI